LSRQTAGCCRFLLKSGGVGPSLAPCTYRVVPFMKRPAKARHQCCRCPLRGPRGRCLNPTLRSGRCGDWIWYLRGGKQCRRRYARPRDPGTLAQLLCRARLSTSSRRYSRSLTEEERAASIAAGAKLRSRTRLAQSGPLTGQQYWVRKDSAHARVNVKPTKAKTAPQLSQPQRLVRSTSGLHHSPSRVSPESRRLGAVRARAGRGGRGLAARRVNRVAPRLQVLQNQRVTGSAGRRHRGPAGARRWRLARPARKALAPPAARWPAPRVTRTTVTRRRRGAVRLRLPAVAVFG
jgi:hypothetical protein